MIYNYNTTIPNKQSVIMNKFYFWNEIVDVDEKWSLVTNMIFS